MNTPSCVVCGRKSRWRGDACSVRCSQQLDHTRRMAAGKPRRRRLSDALMPILWTRELFTPDETEPEWLTAALLPPPLPWDAPTRWSLGAALRLRGDALPRLR
jgi:hypothetical protein